MNEEIFKEILPEEYLQRFIANNLRPDGRHLDEGRNLDVSVGLLSSKDSSCLVKIGDTSVICSIKLQLNDKNKNKKLVPNDSKQESLDVVFDCGVNNDEELTNYERSSFESYWISLLEEIILNNYGKIFEDLKLSETLSWHIQINFKIVANRGNISDCLFYAMNFAILTAKVPEVKVGSDKDHQELTVNYANTRPLKVPKDLIYLPFTYALLEDANILYDPTKFEENISSCVITILKNPSNGKIINQKLSGSEISIKQLKMLEELSFKKGKELLEQIENFISDKNKDKALFYL